MYEMPQALVCPIVCWGRQSYARMLRQRRHHGTASQPTVPSPQALQSPLHYALHAVRSATTRWLSQISLETRLSRTRLAAGGPFVRPSHYVLGNSSRAGNSADSKSACSPAASQQRLLWIQHDLPCTLRHIHSKLCLLPFGKNSAEERIPACAGGI